MSSAVKTGYRIQQGMGFLCKAQGSFFFLLLLLWRFQSLIPRIEKEEKGILKIIFATSIFLHPKFSVGFRLQTMKACLVPILWIIKSHFLYSSQKKKDASLGTKCPLFCFTRLTVIEIKENQIQCFPNIFHGAHKILL